METRRRQPPPDRLAAVLGQVERARTEDGWLPQESAIAQGRRRGVGPAAAGPTRRRAQREHEIDHDEDPEELRPHRPLIRPPLRLERSLVAPSRVAVVAVLVMALCVGVVLGARVLWLRMSSSPTTIPAPAAPMSPAAGSAGSAPVQGRALGTAAAPERPGAMSAPSPVAGAGSSAVVHVVGQVHRPGVVSLPAGARVRDAVAAAGGALPTADLGLLNLARAVQDGEQVRVPKPGEPVSSLPVTPGGNASGTGGPSAGGSPGGPVNLNTAAEGDLDALPGIGPVLAARIVQWRTEHGRFTAVDDVGEVSGIGEKLLEQLRPLVTV